ncbi:MAG: MBOAT family O-acyltransferase [Planctomycetota bacterium]
MLFHTWVFALFFAIVYPVYLLVKQTRLKIPWLLLASYTFYGWWNPLYLLLILYSTFIDYIAVIGMSKSQRKGRWLCLSIVNNLGLLGFFKYARFIVDSLNAVLAQAGIAYAIPAPDVLLPVGMSFFIFQSLTYSIDYYRGHVEKEPSFIHYAAFVSLFPQLLSGPIERARNILPQLHAAPRITRQDVTDGMSLFVVGLFKKVALADYLSLYVDKVYAAPGEYASPALMLATFFFGWQLYFDFSGYTDMARGVARVMGIRLMLNFNNPYLADSLGDFWQRWHISLSTWFKDYVYIPLGGNRRGTVRTYVNMCLTMLISGLWHGAAWTFVIWGGLHAFGRILTRELERTAFYRDRVPRFAKQMFVFAFVTFAWIFFRAASFADARLIVWRMFTVPGGQQADPACPVLALILIFAVWIYQFLYESRIRWTLQLAPVRIGLVASMILYISIFAKSGAQAFIYFQF